MFYFFWHGVFAVHLNLLAQLKNIRKNQDIGLKTLLLNSSSTLVRHSLLTIYDGIRRPLILRHILSGLHLVRFTFYLKCFHLSWAIYKYCTVFFFVLQAKIHKGTEYWLILLKKSGSNLNLTNEILA